MTTHRIDNSPADTPVWSASARIDIMLGKGQEHTISQRPTGTLAEVAKSLAGTFPTYRRKVYIGQHNGGGLDVRCGLSAEAHSPAEYGHHARFEAYVSRQDYGTPTDADWAVLVESFVAAGAEVVAPNAPSSILWSHGVNGGGCYATAPDAEAKARVAKATS